MAARHLAGRRPGCIDLRWAPALRGHDSDDAAINTSDQRGGRLHRHPGDHGGLPTSSRRVRAAGLRASSDLHSIQRCHLVALSSPGATLDATDPPYDRARDWAPATIRATVQRARRSDLTPHAGSQNSRSRSPPLPAAFPARRSLRAGRPARPARLCAAVRRRGLQRHGRPWWTTPTLPKRGDGSAKAMLRPLAASGRGYHDGDAARDFGDPAACAAGVQRARRCPMLPACLPRFCQWLTSGAHSGRATARPGFPTSCSPRPPANLNPRIRLPWYRHQPAAAAPGAPDQCPRRNTFSARRSFF